MEVVRNVYSQLKESILGRNNGLFLTGSLEYDYLPKKSRPQICTFQIVSKPLAGIAKTLSYI
jgi:hypothetical protein